jgi:hypothetical protein
MHRPADRRRVLQTTQTVMQVLQRCYEKEWATLWLIRPTLYYCHMCRGWSPPGSVFTRTQDREPKQLYTMPRPMEGNVTTCILTKASLLHPCCIKQWGEVAGNWRGHSRKRDIPNGQNMPPHNPLPCQTLDMTSHISSAQTVYVHASSSS